MLARVHTCGFVLKVLQHFHGASALFGHINAPDVRRVEVYEPEYPGLHTEIRHACPHANVLPSTAGMSNVRLVGVI